MGEGGCRPSDPLLWTAINNELWCKDGSEMRNAKEREYKREPHALPLSPPHPPFPSPTPPDIHLIL